jgi:hypothetical protein
MLKGGDKADSLLQYCGFNHIPDRMSTVHYDELTFAAEREGYNARQMLASIARKIAETEVGISVVTLIELAIERPVRIPLSERPSGKSSSKNC